ncbi:hypothetical protein [Micromonospora sp. NPDC005324]|uniref:hypothetical protein n=1 Tax=Micromonospora sp. NPDC005324 TaxID=3157033 RepID=UPI0033A89D08
MNQYVVDDAGQTSGFGAYSLTYIWPDFSGVDAPDGVTSGRWWTHYVNSSPVVPFEAESLEFLEPDHPAYALRPADPLEIVWGFFAVAAGGQQVTAVPVKRGSSQLGLALRYRQGARLGVDQCASAGGRRRAGPHQIQGEPDAGA